VVRARRADREPIYGFVFFECGREPPEAFRGATEAILESKQ
jgi:hypothetical protein